MAVLSGQQQEGFGKEPEGQSVQLDIVWNIEGSMESIKELVQIS